jgi:hypothetical protein
MSYDVNWDDAGTEEATADDLAVLERVKAAAGVKMSDLLGLSLDEHKQASAAIEVVLAAPEVKSPYLVGFIQMLLVSPNGDTQSLYACDKCWTPLPHFLSQGSTYACPNEKCRHVDSTARVRDKTFVRVTPAKMATLVLDLWRKLDCDADIVLRRFRVSAHATVMAHRSKDWRVYERMREAGKEKTERVVYLRDRLMQDNINGQDMIRLLKGFFTA